MSNEKVYIPTEAIEEVALLEGSESALAKSIDNKDGLPRLTMEDVESGYVTLKLAKVALSLKHLMYVRRLVKENKLEGIRVKVPGGSRWLVTKESIEAYRTKQRARGTKRNYILRIEPTEEATLRKLLKDNGIDYSLELAYEAKAKSPTAGEDLWAKVIENLS